MTSSTADAIDVTALRSLYGSSAVARAVLDHFAVRKNSSSKTTLNRLLATIQADGQDVVRNDVRQVFRALEQAKCGVFVVGRKGHPSRFEWGVSLIDVGRAARGEHVSVQVLKEPAAPSRSPVLEDDGLLEHRYRLRPDLELRFDLPANLTSAEAGRVADFIRTLPFA